MRVHKAKEPPEVFTGTLKFGPIVADADYTVTGDAKLTVGKGSLIAGPDELRAAFRAGRATLRLADGRDLPIVVVAHTEGGSTAFFEIGR